MDDQNNQHKQNVRRVSIVDEMKRSYIDYAMSVIVSRALPDVRDGLKPVQRRIIYAMYREGIVAGSKYSKCMGVVGEVLKKYHPHGDASVYDALARMVQDWVMRYPLIDGQGNFGSVDGDSPAASRYTECRLEKITTKFVEEIEKQTVDFIPNYTGEDLEPTVLPVSLPNLLLNGADGIAVGMATKIPPHNMSEVIDGVLFMIKSGNKASGLNFNYADYAAKDYYEAANYDIKNKGIPFPKFESDVSTDDLMQFIKGPDFPTGAEVYNVNEIKLAYETGKGRALMRAVAKIEDLGKGRTQIVITELPYQVNKAKLAERFYELYRDGKIDGIADIRDESTAKEGMRLVVELKKGVSANVVLNKLYKFTEMQSSFNFNMVAIVDREPRVLSLRELLEQFIRHRYEVVIRSSIFDLNQNIQKIHILEGLKIALDHIDEIIQTIRSSRNSDEAKKALMERFSFSDVQAQAILDMQLRRLAALERQKVEEEYNAVLSSITNLKALLNSQQKIEEVIMTELEEVKQKFGDKRKTKIIRSNPGELNEEDLVQKENIIVTISHSGYIKRVKESEFKQQSRGGKGSVGSLIKEGDYIEHLLYCNTHSEVLLFTNLGKVYSMRAFDIPEMNKKTKGVYLANLMSLASGEVVTSVLSRDAGVLQKLFDEDETQEGEQGSSFGPSKYLFMATRKGFVKKVPIEEFSDIRKNGLIAINLTQGDELIFVRPTIGDSDVIIMTKNARTVRFRETKVSPTGRNSRGVRGIKLIGDDQVIMMDVVRTNEDRVLVISSRGFGKLTPLVDFPLKGRGTKGTLGYRITEKTGTVAIARIIDHPKRELLLMSRKAQSIRISLESVRVTGRVASGVLVFRLDGDDSVVACAVI